MAGGNQSRFDAHPLSDQRDRHRSPRHCGPDGGLRRDFFRPVLVRQGPEETQVWVSAKEADIGKIHEKQAVRFTVDAFPGKSFEGKVAQIRLNAAVTKGVVAYTVVVATDNASGKLLPYLTANVQFEVQATER